MGIEDLLKCAPMLYFFRSMILKAFCVTQNETPKLAKMSVSTNKLSIFLRNVPSVGTLSITHKVKLIARVDCD